MAAAAINTEEMQVKNNFAVTLLAALLPVLSISVMAHGDAHEKKKPVAVKKNRNPGV